MGNLSWTIVIGLILTVTYGIYASSKSVVETTTVQSNYQEQVLAREMARSGYNVALSNLEQNFTTYRPANQEANLKSGTYKLNIAGPSGGPVTVSVLGSMIGADHQIEAGVQRKHFFPDAISFDGEIDEVVASGNYTITGLDTNPSTLIPGSGGGLGTHAIKANNAATVALFSAVTDTARVLGVKGYGDIEYRALQVEIDSLIAEVQDEPTLLTYTSDKVYASQTVGSVGSPAFIEVNGNVELTGTTHGCGILVVHGDLAMNSDAHWEGLIIARGGNNIDLLGSSAIVGGLLVSMEAATGTSDGVAGGCETVRYKGEGDDDDDDGASGGASLTCPPSSYDGNDDDDGGDGDDDDGYADDDDGIGANDDDDGFGSGGTGGGTGGGSGTAASHRRFVIQDNAGVYFSWNAYSRCVGNFNTIRSPGIEVTSVKEVDL